MLTELKVLHRGFCLLESVRLCKRFLTFIKNTGLLTFPQNPEIKPYHEPLESGPNIICFSKVHGIWSWLRPKRDKDTDLAQILAFLKRIVVSIPVSLVLETLCFAV